MDKLIQRIKFIHCADIHMDMPFTSLGESGIGSIRRRDIKNTFNRIISLVKSEQADLLLIAGDLFEHEYSSKASAAFINEGFKEISGTEVAIIPGNHDPEAADSLYTNFVWNSNVHILTSAAPRLWLPELGTSIYMPVREGAGLNLKLPANAAGISKEHFNILLFHGTPGMSFAKDSYNPAAIHELDSLGMDYIALGHFHNVLEALGKSANIYNPGSPEALGFDEPGAHGVFSGSLVRRQNNVSLEDMRFIPTASRYYKSLNIDISGCRTDEQIIRAIDDSLNGCDAEKGLFSLSLNGFKDRDFAIDMKYILSVFRNRLFYVNIKAKIQDGYDLEEVSKEPGLRGLFVRKLLDRLGPEADENMREVYLAAIRYGLEAMEKGSVTV